MLEPYYDSYPATIAFAGAAAAGDAARAGLRAGSRRAAGRGRAADPDAAAQHAAQPDRPGAVTAELDAIAQVCIDHDLVCISDEVYEHLVYDGEHMPPATLPGWRSGR